jgi:hypothetical protein
MQCVYCEVGNELAQCSSRQSNYRHTCSTLCTPTCHALSTQATGCQKAHSGPNTVLCTRIILLGLQAPRTFLVRRHTLTAKDRERGRLREDIPRVPCSDSFNLSRQIGYRFTNYNTQLMSLRLNSFHHNVTYWAPKTMDMRTNVFLHVP